MTKFKIENISTEKLIPYSKALRNHSKDKITKLSKLISAFGFLTPILVDSEKQEIIAGEARLLAAKGLGLKDIPTIQVSHLTQAQIKAFRIADNKISEGSSWDTEALKLEFLDLQELGFDLSLTAFELPEIEMLILDDEQNFSDEESIPAPASNTYLRLGDIFVVGRHTVICGDSRDSSLITNHIDEKLVDIVVSDPPYNVKINGHVLASESSHEEFAMASGEMSTAEFTEFLTEWFQSSFGVSKEGSTHYHFMDHHHLKEMLDAGDAVYDKRLNICIWSKTNAGMGSFYRSQHEMCCVFKKGTESHTNNIQLGKFGRNRSNIWTYPGMNTFSSDRDKLLASHPTVKNTEMIADILLDASNPGELVLDGFLGSGTTLIAAERTNRICIGVEIEPKYIDVTIKRFQALSDEPVTHKLSGLTYEELIAKRLSEQKEEDNE